MEQLFKFCFCLADTWLIYYVYPFLISYFFTATTAWLVQRMTKPFWLVNLFIFLFCGLLYSQDILNLRTCLHSCLKADVLIQLYIRGLGTIHIIRKQILGHFLKFPPWIWCWPANYRPHSEDIKWKASFLIG